MSVSPVPSNGDSSEAEVAAVMKNLMSTQYGLSQEDQQTVARLVQYSQDKTGLTEAEKKKLVKHGMMDETEFTLYVPEEFMFRGTVTPSFWMKCLLALRDLIDFGVRENEKTPSK
jgi:hypothetical protein